MSLPTDPALSRGVTAKSTAGNGSISPHREHANLPSLEAQKGISFADMLANEPMVDRKSGGGGSGGVQLVERDQRETENQQSREDSVQGAHGGESRDSASSVGNKSATESPNSRAEQIALLATQMVKAVDGNALRHGQGELRLSLDTGGLGLSGLTLKRNARGRFDITLAADHQAARSLVQRNVQELSEALASRGLRAGRIATELMPARAYAPELMPERPTIAPYSAQSEPRGSHKDGSDGRQDGQRHGGGHGGRQPGSDAHPNLVIEEGF